MTQEETIRAQAAEIAALRQQLKRRRQIMDNDLKTRKTISCRVDRETAQAIEKAAEHRGVSVYRFVMQSIQHEMSRPRT